MVRSAEGIIKTLLPLKPGYGLGKTTNLPNNPSGRTQGYAKDCTGMGHCKTNINPISMTNTAQITSEIAFAENLRVCNKLEIWAY
jgi:hypothetical protein